jgi:small nuclear ribonucleoprotein (snRNP)-like protein
MERPLDTLVALKGKKVNVTLKGNKEISGILVACDLNTNLTLKVDNVEQLIQGNTVLSVSSE